MGWMARLLGKERGSQDKQSRADKVSDALALARKAKASISDLKRTGNPEAVRPHLERIAHMLGPEDAASKAAAAAAEKAGNFHEYAQVESLIDDLMRMLERDPAMSRRTFLKVAGLAAAGIALGDAVFELSGGRGIVRTAQGVLSSASSDQERSQALAKARLPEPIASPSFMAGEMPAKFMQERARFYVKDVQAILDRFETPSDASPAQLARQVAYLQGKEQLLSIPEKGQVLNRYESSQKLLLPTSDPYSALFIGDYHSIRDLRSAGIDDMRFYVHPGVFDDPEFDFVMFSWRLNCIFAYSEKCDLAIGYVRSSRRLRLAMPSFSTRCAPSSGIMLMPSAASRNDNKPTRGTVLQCNSSYLLTDAWSEKGYSGSPVLDGGGHVLGFLNGGIHTAQGEYLGVSAGVRSPHVQQLLRFYVASFR